MLHPTPILPEILRRRSSEYARHRRPTLRVGRRALCSHEKRDHRAGAVREPRLSAERARRHTLEAESKRTARIASADERRGLHERSAPRRAVVVHVRDWDAR
jgi:hypothetical protein